MQWSLAERSGFLSPRVLLIQGGEKGALRPQLGDGIAALPFGADLQQREKVDNG